MHTDGHWWKRKSEDIKETVERKNHRKIPSQRFAQTVRNAVMDGRRFAIAL
jgi:hypothetical protein